MKFVTIHHSPTKEELSTVLIPKISSKWHAFGECLITDDQLKEIQNNEADTADHRLDTVLERWLADSDKPHTWGDILDALNSVEEGLLAGYVQQTLLY